MFVNRLSLWSPALPQINVGFIAVYVAMSEHINPLVRKPKHCTLNVCTRLLMNIHEAELCGNLKFTIADTYIVRKKLVSGKQNHILLHLVL